MRLVDIGLNTSMLAIDAQPYKAIHTLMLCLGLLALASRLVPLISAIRPAHQRPWSSPLMLAFATGA
jgi:hypothetical protein